MIIFADITIPTLTARHLAAATDDRTAADDGYAVKSALAEAFGHGSVRPWKMISRDDGMFRIVGIVASPDAVRNNSVSRGLGIVVETSVFECAEGDVFEIAVQATPVKRVTHRDPVTWEKSATIMADVSSVQTIVDGRRTYPAAEGDERRIAYMGWLIETLSKPDTGVVPIDLPDIGSVRPAERLRKVKGGVRTIRTPCLDAKARVRIRDVPAFEGFMSRGVKLMKDVGLGSVIPVSVIEELAA